MPGCAETLVSRSYVVLEHTLFRHASQLGCTVPAGCRCSMTTGCTFCSWASPLLRTRRSWSRLSTSPSIIPSCWVGGLCRFSCLTWAWACTAFRSVAHPPAAHLLLHSSSSLCLPHGWAATRPSSGCSMRAGATPSLCLQQSTSGPHRCADCLRSMPHRRLAAPMDLDRRTHTGRRPSVLPRAAFSLRIAGLSVAPDATRCLAVVR